MLIYCVDKDNTEAVTVGALIWLPYDKNLADLSEAEILHICRPRDAKRVPAFDVYVQEMHARYSGQLRYVSKSELPEGCKRRTGYWENHGFK